MANIIQWNGVSYNKQPYPGWAELLGWMMALASILLIPGFAIHQMWKTPGTLSEVIFVSPDLLFFYRITSPYIKYLPLYSLYKYHILVLFYFASFRGFSSFLFFVIYANDGLYCLKL